MAEFALGRVLYANGTPAAGVRVRIFDRDLGGSDDDLTITEGLSDQDGSFRVEYDQSRAADRISVTTTEPRSLLDWTLVQRTRTLDDPLDIYMPYVQCRYVLHGVERSTNIEFSNGPLELRLPEPPPREPNFVPSQHGWHFLNSFPGSPLPFSLPTLPGIGSIPSYYGLCGGMSASAADFFYARRPIPALREAPVKRTAMYKYLFRRQMDSFSPFGEPVMRFVKWMKLGERIPLGTWHRTSDEIGRLRDMFSAGVPLQPLGLVFANPGMPLWENHQVLAFNLIDRSATQADILIYDPNYPENDQVFIRCMLRNCEVEGAACGVTGYSCERVAIIAGPDGQAMEQVRPMRGMFLMPYTPIAPPTNL